MTWHHTTSGVLYMIGIMMLCDGGLYAKDVVHDPYIFVDVLPLLLTSLGLILFALTSVKAILSAAAGDGGGGYDPIGAAGGFGGDDEAFAANRARVTFFVAAFFQLAGFGVAIWRWVYFKHTAWAGAANVFMTLIHMASAFALSAGEKKAADAAEGAGSMF